MVGNRSCLLPINLKCFASKYFNWIEMCFPMCFLFLQIVYFICKAHFIHKRFAHVHRHYGIEIDEVLHDNDNYGELKNWNEE